MQSRRGSPRRLSAIAAATLAWLGLVSVAMLSPHQTVEAAPLCQAVKKLAGAVKARGCVTRGDLRNNSIDSVRIRNASVGAADLATNAVTRAKIRNSAVTGAKVADGTVTAADLGPNSVGTSEIAAGAVGASEIATGAVSSHHVKDDSLTADDRLDEAGVVMVASDQTTNIQFTTQSVHSTSITAPTAGVVIVIATGYFELSETLSIQRDFVGCSLSTTDVFDTAHASWVAEGDNSTEIWRVPFGLTRGLEVDSGEVAINLLCSIGDGTVSVAMANVTAVFVPTGY